MNLHIISNVALLIFTLDILFIVHLRSSRVFLTEDVINLQISYLNFIQLPFQKVNSIHPIKIKPSFDYSSTIQNYQSINEFAKLFHIASYYFQKVIQVQNISPSNQTILRKKPSPFTIQQNITIDIKISQYYLKYGFNPQNVDMIIFVNFLNLLKFRNQYSGVLQVQRRPLYGFILYDIDFPYFYRNKVQYFNTQLKWTIHSFIHILAFNTNYFLKNPVQNVQSIIIDQNYKTAFFQNPYSDVKKNQSSVLKKHSKRNQFILITDTIQKFITQLFYCQNMSYTGFSLQNFFSISLNKTILSNHFSINYGIRQEIMQVLTNQNQFHLDQIRYNAKITELSLSLIKDTGFYEHVEISQKTTDYLANINETQDRYSIAFYNQKYYTCNFQSTQLSIKEQYCIFNDTVLQCDIYGQILQQSYPIANSNINFTQDITYRPCSNQTLINCKSYDFNRGRCLLPTQFLDRFQWSNNQYCFQAACIQKNQKIFLKLVFAGSTYFGCSQGEQQLVITQDIKLKCPYSINIFCAAKNPSKNLCSYQGLSVRGQCFIPQSKQYQLQNFLFSSIFWQKKYYFNQLSNQFFLCPRGCLICEQNGKCVIPKKNYNFFEITFGAINQNGTQYQKKAYGFPGYSNYTYIALVPCIEGCQWCSYNNLYLIYPWDLQTFLHEQISKCHKCYQQFQLVSYTANSNICLKCTDSTCTSCLQQDFLVTQCTNCIQGSFVHQEKYCLMCANLQNCMNCQRNQLNNLQCIQCFSGYFITQENKCIKCLPNCGKCDNKDITICSSCFQGYYLIQYQDNFYCRPCSNNCKFCTIQECIQCFEGFQFIYFYIQSNFTIQRTSQCLNLSQKCSYGFLYNSTSGNCTINQIFQDKQTDPSINCPDGYGMQINKTSYPLELYCKKCSIPYCASCLIRSRICIRCQNGYYLRPRNLLCMICPKGCMTCHSSSICLTCKEGYTKAKNIDGTKYKNKCLQCSHNCLTCSGSPHECLTCKQHYEKIGQTCLPSLISMNYYFELDMNNQFFIQRYYLQILDKILTQLSLQSIFTQTLVNINKQKNLIQAHLGSNLNDANKYLKDQIQNISGSFVFQNLKNSDMKFLTDQSMKSIPDECYFNVYLQYKFQKIQRITINNNIEFEIKNLSYQNKQSTTKCEAYYIKTQQLNSINNSQGIPVKILIIIIIPTVVVFLLIIICICFYYRKKINQIKIQLKPQIGKKTNKQYVGNVDSQSNEQSNA